MRVLNTRCVLLIQSWVSLLEAPVGGNRARIRVGVRPFFQRTKKNVEEKIDFDKKRGAKIIEAEIRKTKRCDRLRKCVESDFEQRQSQCFFTSLSLSLSLSLSCEPEIPNLNCLVNPVAVVDVKAAVVVFAVASVVLCFCFVSSNR